MIRLICILLAITALSLGVSWVADEPGRVVIEWGSYHIETSLLVLLAGAALAALWCIILYYILFSILRAPRSLLRSKLAKRQALGLEALTAAFAAIATQDKRAARKQIGRAQRYLPHQPLTLMLASQVARLEGNESQSRLYLEQMLKAEGSEYMALRGLIEAARRSHDDDAALLHAEKALTLKADDPWLATTLAGLYVKKRRTQDALRLLDRARRKGAIAREEQRRLSAGALLEHARLLMKEQRLDMAVAGLHEALRNLPHFAPASAELARAHLAEGHVPGALKAIGRAWKAAPHPLLTEALLACYAPEKTRGKVTRTAQRLAQMHPQNRESHFLIASMALKTGDAGVARTEATRLIAERETVRACMLMAQLQQASGDDAAASDWLKRAHTATPDPGFACESCHQIAEDWHLNCRYCGSVGSSVWK